MKTRALLFTICIIITTIHSHAQSQKTWEYVNTIENEWMNKVYAQGSDVVFVVGENGLVAKSTDKALTWHKQYIPSQVTLNDILFCNENIGFIVGNSGTILKTEDAGIHWEQILIEATQDIRAISSESDNIWIVGNEGLVMYSIDQGKSWITKHIIPDNRDLYDIKFQDKLGYITGKGKYITKTTDGGITWIDQPISENITNADVAFSLSITENKVHVLVVNNDPHTSIFTESNNQWIMDDKIQFSTGIYFCNDSKGMLIAHDWPSSSSSRYTIFIYQTEDGGISWEMNHSLWNYAHNQPNRSPEKGNFVFAENNDFGYCLAGEILLRTPYTGEFLNNQGGTDEIKLKNNLLSIRQFENTLRISSSKIISALEIVSLEGVTFAKKTNITATEIAIDVNQLPHGIYFMHSVFTDKTNHIVKWIKR